MAPLKKWKEVRIILLLRSFVKKHMFNTAFLSVSYLTIVKQQVHTWTFVPKVIKVMQSKAVNWRLSRISTSEDAPGHILSKYISQPFSISELYAFRLSTDFQDTLKKYSLSSTDIFTNSVGKNFFQPERFSNTLARRSISSLSSIFKMRLTVTRES